MEDREEFEDEELEKLENVEALKAREYVLLVSYLTLERSLNLLTLTLEGYEEDLTKRGTETLPDLALRKAYCEMAKDLVRELVSELEYFSIKPH
jgi:hypothetical protein